MATTTKDILLDELENIEDLKDMLLASFTLDKALLSDIQHNSYEISSREIIGINILKNTMLVKLNDIQKNIDMAQKKA